MRDCTFERREFLAAAATAALGISAVTSQGASADAPALGQGILQKAVLYSMLPKNADDKEKFAMAKRAGFEGIEAPPLDDMAKAKEMGALAKEAGVPIHSVIYGGWGPTLSEAVPALMDKSVALVENALRCAQAYGADNILLVPAVVTDNVRYVEAYERSQRNIRKLIPLAEELKVVIAVEEVWNKFLLSPIEFAKYIDEFESPWVRAYFDVGNVIIHGYAEDWIRTLGKRIFKVHIKDFKRKDYSWPALLEGDVNWKEVRRAFAEIGFTGFGTAELAGGDESYLTDVSARMTKIFTGEGL
jgi:L-ribulose-5-phosphate 3-epimerase